MISLFQVPVFTGLYFLLRRSAPAAALLGSLAGLIYSIYTAAAYWVQLVLVTRLPELYLRTGSAGEKAAIEQQYHFFASFKQYSPVYALDQLGYFVLALASLVLGLALQRKFKGAGYALFVSGLAGVAGATGYLAGLPWLETGNLASGVVYLFFLVLISRIFFISVKQ